MGVRGDGSVLCMAVCLSVSEMHTTTATRLLPLLPSLLKIMIILY